MIERMDAEQLAALIGAVQHGDGAAFADFYDQLVPLVFGIALNTARDLSKAQMITERAFVTMWRQAPRFDSSQLSVRSWASQVTRRQAERFS